MVTGTGGVVEEHVEQRGTCVNETTTGFSKQNSGDIGGHVHDSGVESVRNVNVNGKEFTLTKTAGSLTVGSEPEVRKSRVQTENADVLNGTYRH
jgi:hypothetical protein